MRRVAIVSPVRTPIGAFGGALRDVPVEELAGLVVRAVVDRSGVDPDRVDDVVFAQSYPNGEAPCVGRWAALQAGLPVHVPGLQVDRRCGGGLQALATAAMMVQTGAADIVIAGGVESMSNVEFYTTAVRWGRRAGSAVLYDRLERARARSQPASRFGAISGMIETAENLAFDHRIDRASSDAFALRSHRLAAAAWGSGRFDDELVPVPIGPDDAKLLTRDEGVRPDTSAEALAALAPVLRGGTVTAGNASQQSDAAAACLVVAEEHLKTLRVAPMGIVLGSAVAGCEPSRMGIGPVPAVERLTRRVRLGLDDMDLVEINEAFACQVLAVLKLLRWSDLDRLNVNGSGISLGHPIGATGVRMVTTLLHELHRRRGRYGLATMCAGGGQGVAMMFEQP